MLLGFCLASNSGEARRLFDLYFFIGFSVSSFRIRLKNFLRMCFTNSEELCSIHAGFSSFRYLETIGSDALESKQSSIVKGVVFELSVLSSFLDF
jgi:hypothetical protein